MYRPLDVVFVLLGLVLSLAGGAAAQEPAPPDTVLAVEIHWPNEGETVYGGPSSLLYKIPVKGEIASTVYDLQDVAVQLEILKDDVSLGVLRHTGQADGQFAFDVTVNPHASTEEFTIGFTDCGLLCHSEGELALRAGRLEARVTAVAPDGMRETATRHFVVDIAGTATVPVQLVLAGSEETPVPGVTVSAATWLYQWRSRFGVAQSDAWGQADVRVEALGQAPTYYQFRVEPTIVDGVMYEGLETVDVALEPGATTGPAIQLQVRALRGQVTGHVSADGPPGGHLVRAISLPEGHCMTSETDQEGGFVFEELAVDQYLLAVSDGHAAGQVALPAPDRRRIDLTQHLTETVRLTLAEPPLAAQGVMQGANGRRLPFGWVHSGERRAGVLPDSGHFYLTAQGAEEAALVASAPGHFAAAVPLTGQVPGEELVVALKPQAATRTLAWGAGEMVLPAGNVQEVNGQAITLQRGYLWGQGASSSSWVIHTPKARITVTAGDFALQVVPDEAAWLYLFAGEARASDATGREVLVQGGQMVNLLNAEGLQPVPYDPFVLAALEVNTASPPAPLWEPSLAARMRDGLARLGVGTAQVVTMVTYLLIVVALVAAPVLVVLRRRGARLRGDAR